MKHNMTMELPRNESPRWSFMLLECFVSPKDMGQKEGNTKNIQMNRLFFAGRIPPWQESSPSRGGRRYAEDDYYSLLLAPENIGLVSPADFQGYVGDWKPQQSANSFVTAYSVHETAISRETLKLSGR